MCHVTIYTVCFVGLALLRYSPVECRPTGGTQNEPCPGCDNQIRCKSIQFGCNNEFRCLPLLWKCDGETDCSDGSDEVGCPPVRCRSDKFLCDQTRCVAKRWRCDGARDCFDNSDEIGCENGALSEPLTNHGDVSPTIPTGLPQCQSYQFRCGNGYCIHASWRCDGKTDCRDDSDEVGCVNSTLPGSLTGLPTTVSPICDLSLEFRCNNGSCVDKILRCDGESDCGDGSDEVGCDNKDLAGNLTDLPSSFSQGNGTGLTGTQCNSSVEFHCDNDICIEKGWRCDGENDCGDGSDEVGCNNRTLAGNLNGVPNTAAEDSPQCQSYQFQCDDDSCIHKSWMCDGDADCRDGSDEATCNRTVQCKSIEFICDQKCLPILWRCDGEVDCGDGSDEVRCDNGNLAENFTDIITISQGVGQVDIQCNSSTEFRCGDGSCIDRNWRCDGEADCSGDAADELGCVNGTLASNFTDVLTTQGFLRCPSHHFLCDNSTCIHRSLICDGDADCRDGSDEIMCNRTGQCKASEFLCGERCMPIQWICDGEADCGDGSDEVGCNNGTLACNLTGLPNATTVFQGCDITTEFRCSNGFCVLKNWRCDGETDCGDASDEVGCENGTLAGNFTGVPTNVAPVTIPCILSDIFRCEDGNAFVHTSWRCDGDADCKDGSDEFGCDNGTLPGNFTDVLLAASPVTVDCAADTYELDCNSSPHCNSSRFVCNDGKRCLPLAWRCDRQSDCDDGSDEIGCNGTICDVATQFACDNGSCVDNNWRCDGDRDCTDGADEMGCNMTVQCQSSEFLCGEKCVPALWRCDGENDCGDGSDEIGCDNVTDIPDMFSTQLRN
ncbi:low-density lipoprotein receptor-related protein 2-like [Lineus longissimus]|uniref:low-density lipoprotein receptor-related protein 2-like n=1 Tax=Lineus longissimus TaxID=88925 RepID=UPI002B4C351C